VTAGGRGIGYCIARQFASAASECTSATCRVRTARCERSDPAIGTSLCDVSDDDDVERLFDEVVQRLGGLEFLINTPVSRVRRRWSRRHATEWRQTMAVNIDGQFYCARSAVPLLKQAAAANREYLVRGRKTRIPDALSLRGVQVGRHRVTQSLAWNWGFQYSRQRDTAG